MKERRWHGRGFTSLLTLVGFIIMSVTGLVLYLVPQGRIAYWTEWKLLWLTKEAWGDIHILSSLLFVGAGIMHVVYNWRPLMNYLKGRVGGSLKLKKELVVSGVVGLLLVVSAIAHVPPLSYLLTLNAAIKDAWVSQPDYEPPFGHAELLSLKVFCKKTNIPLEPAVKTLTDAGWTDVDPGSRLVDIARANEASPLDLYRLIRKHEIVAEVEAPDAGRWTPEQVEETFAGTGLGNKSWQDIADQLDMDVAVATARLARKGIEAAATDNVKAAASRSGFAPIEVLKAALVDYYLPQK